LVLPELRHLVALLLTILRRFTRGGPKHPTYLALEELGRADSDFLTDFHRRVHLGGHP